MQHQIDDERLPQQSCWGKNYHALECKTDFEKQFVVAVMKGKTIEVSHTCSKTLSSETLV